ncbi:MAG: hypothetical protein QGI33_04330 [Candidatus Brocadiia bacterium]|nr:hypothetical protein [Candidatus Brocadiia bacterium]
MPIVYNCGGYESLEMLRFLEGTVDIYMPDAKYWDEEEARRYSAAPDYPDIMREALREMRRQVGNLDVVGGVARRGLLIRHLVMPGGVSGSRAILDFIAGEISPARGSTSWTSTAPPTAPTSSRQSRASPRRRSSARPASTRRGLA